MRIDSQVAEGTWARNRYTLKLVQLSLDCRQIAWDDGKKSVDLSHVVRISVGLETRTLQRLYSGPSGPDDVSSHHWFSLHTNTRSYDFGAVAESGDENEAVVLWVMTLQDILARRLPADALRGACCALSNAQYQWQRFDNPMKEYPCLLCTMLNPPDCPQCIACSSPRPLVTLCPCLTPLLPALRALANTLGLRSFEEGPEAHLLWFLVQALESPLPEPFLWATRARLSTPDESYLIMFAPTQEEGNSEGFETGNHPHLVELRKAADTLRQQLMNNGGRPDFSQPLTPKFVAPDTTRSSNPGSSSRGDDESADSGSLSTRRSFLGGQTPPAGLSQREFEEALLAAEALESQRQRREQQEPTTFVETPRGASFEQSGPLDAADVFRYCMSGDVEQVRRFLELGGHADTVYKHAYGWDVGPDWLFTKPSDGITVLNYVATWTDIIGDNAVEIARLLLNAGADLQRDDAQEEWFTPIHNAVANGASALVAVMLEFMPEAIHLTTGDGRQPLHVLSLCDDPTDRISTLHVLLRSRPSRDGASACAPNLGFCEPYYGNSALHSAARDGHSEVVIGLLEAGAPIVCLNEAGRTPLEEAKAELALLQDEGQPQTAMRRSRLETTIEMMEIAVVGYA